MNTVLTDKEIALEVHRTALALYLARNKGLTHPWALSDDELKLVRIYEDAACDEYADADFRKCVSWARAMLYCSEYYDMPDFGGHESKANTEEAAA